jgi:serine/threonine protein kinase
MVDVWVNQTNRLPEIKPVFRLIAAALTVNQEAPVVRREQVLSDVPFDVIGPDRPARVPKLFCQGELFVTREGPAECLDVDSQFESFSVNVRILVAHTTYNGRSKKCTKEFQPSVSCQPSARQPSAAFCFPLCYRYITVTNSIMSENQDRYEIRDVLGQGAMGVVYRAWDTALNRLVALKVMATSLSSNAELRIRFYREARSAASLTHPNIVTVYDFGEANKQVFIAMELVEGKSLRDLLKVPMALDQKLDIMVQIGRALAFAHQNGVVHRDVKPGNILIRNDQVVKILDFGVAHLASSELTQTGTRLGTPEYMSPEMIEGAKVDHRSDIFSCGIVFYELLTATKPFYDQSLTALMDKIISRDLPPVSQLAPDVPPALDAILRKMLEKQPVDRYQSLDETVADLKELQGELLLVKVDRIRELKALYQTLVGIESDACKDEFCNAVFSHELGQELKEAKESLRALSDPSHTSVTLQALDYGKTDLQERIERFRSFAATVLPERVAERDRLVGQFENQITAHDFEQAEDTLRLLHDLGCPDASLNIWRQKVQSGREEQVRALAQQHPPGPPVVPPPFPGQPKADSQYAGSRSEVVGGQPQAGQGVLEKLAEDFLGEAREDLRKRDYAACRKSLKRVFQLSPENDEARQMLKRLDEIESGEATVMASWEQLEQDAAPAAPKEIPAAPRRPKRPIEELPASVPALVRRSIPKLGLIIAGGVALLALLISIPFWLLTSDEGKPDPLTSLDLRVAKAMTEQSYKTETTLPAVLQDIRSLSALKGGQTKANAYLRTIRESYLAEARSREAQKDWQGALQNYQVLTSQLQVAEYQAKVQELGGLIERIQGQSSAQALEPNVQSPVQPVIQPPVTKFPQTGKVGSPLAALDRKVSEAMRAGVYSKPDALPPLLQDIRKLAGMPGGNQKAVTYLTAVQGFYLNEAKRLEASGDRKGALERYRVLIDTIGASEYQAKAAELARLIQSEPGQKEAEALEGKIAASLRNQNLIPPSRDNAWDLVGQLQKLDPANARISSTRATIRQRLEARVSEAVEGNRFMEAADQLKKLATYFPEDRSRWEQRDADIKKAFRQRELVLPARHLHGGSDSCSGELHFTYVSIRYSTSGSHSRSLAFGAISRTQQVGDRLNVSLKIGTWYDFQYMNAADAKKAEEWLRFRETLNSSAPPK